jgi:serine/threonine protein kinase
MTCSKCGATLDPADQFCPNCGAAVGSGRPAAPTGSLPPHTLLRGRYLLQGLIARGGMGAVYRALDTSFNVPVAVKEMAVLPYTADPAGYQAALARFHQEAAMLRQLSHPNLPRVYDQFEQDGRQYLVMDFIAGQTLAEVLAVSPTGLPESQVLLWAEQLCDVLSYLHSQKPPIIYRDLNLRNVMVEPDMQTVKLIDFGIARLWHPRQSGDTGAFGTPGYAPPEQYGKGQTDAASDVYSLGVTLHQLLTRRDPADAPLPSPGLPPVRTLNPAVSEATEKALWRATQLDRGKRHQTVDEFRRDLPLPGPQTPPVNFCPHCQQPVARADQRFCPTCGQLHHVTCFRARGCVNGCPRPLPPSTPRSWRLLAALGTGIGVGFVALILGALALKGVLPAFGSGATPTATVTATTSPSPTWTTTLEPSATPTPTRTPSPTSTPVPTLPPVSRLPVAAVGASAWATPGNDACQPPNRTTYEPTLALDSRPDTAWRVPGESGMWLQVDFPSEVRLHRVGIVPGYDKIDPCDRTDRFSQNRVVQEVRLEFSDGQSENWPLDYDRWMQFMNTDDIRTRFVRLVIVSSYSPRPPSGVEPRQYVALSEVLVEGWTE